MKVLLHAIPLINSLQNYDRESARHDLMAGMTTAILLIPQGLGYAMLAGLPPVYGLYASLVPLLVYAVFGTSRQLAVGPTALVSLLVVTGVGSVTAPNTSSFIAYAVLLALLVGVIQLALGIARLGFLVNFLSHPVISGFTSAAALIIGFSQLKHLVGFSLERTHHIPMLIWALIQQVDQIHWLTLGFGVSIILVLVLLKYWRPRFPRALIVVALSAGLVWFFELDRKGVAIVGEIPDEFPAFGLPVLNVTVIGQLAPIALAIALVGFLESIAIAKRYAQVFQYKLDANQELVALGLSNILGAFGSSYPVTGGFSRTAVNAQAGAKTGLAGLVTAVLIGLTLLFLTSLFYYLPQAVLAALIITAVAGLIDVEEVRRLWKISRTDLSLLLLTFAATLVLGIEEGILVGVGASLLLLIFQSTRPHVAVLGRLPGTRDYRNIKRYPNAQTTPGMLILRLDAQIYFGNVNFLKETLEQLEAEQEHPLYTVVLDASGINRVDTSGEAAFREIYQEYKTRNIELQFAQIKGPVLDVFSRSGFLTKIGEEHFFLNVHEAVEASHPKKRPLPLSQSDKHTHSVEENTS